MIWALETYEQHGRPTCSECTETLKKRRGCRRPGSDYSGGSVVFRYTSPILVESGNDLLKECPVGKILREAPQTYDILDYSARIEATGVEEYSRLPRFMQQAIRLVSSERERLRELKEQKRKAAADSKFGMRRRA